MAIGFVSNGHKGFILFGLDLENGFVSQSRTARVRGERCWLLTVRARAVGARGFEVSEQWHGSQFKDRTGAFGDSG